MFCQFEGSNYNGKQLYEQSDKELDPDEAHIRRTKLQDLELKFENSIEALKTAEHSKRAGAGAGTVQSLAGATSLHHQRQLPPGAAAGLSGILNAETSLLRGSLTMPGSSINSLGLGMNSFPSLAGAFDPALFPGLNPLASVGTTMNAAAVLGMGGLSDYGRIPAAGDLNVDSLLGANASLMGTLPRSMHMAAGTGITFPTLPNIASGNVSYQIRSCRICLPFVAMLIPFLSRALNLTIHTGHDLAAPACTGTTATAAQ